MPGPSLLIIRSIGWGLESSWWAVSLLPLLFAYQLFATEAIDDFKTGQVPVLVTHQSCLEMGEELNNNFQCQVEFTNTLDVFVAFTMLGVFLSGDTLQARRAILNAPSGWGLFFALLAGVEVVYAFFAASIAIRYNLFIGEVTDAVEVGVGLLFIRELRQRTYAGIGSGKTKQFQIFFFMLTVLVAIGLVLDPLSAKMFAGYVQ